jgi:hypothetical protein
MTSTDRLSPALDLAPAPAEEFHAAPDSRPAMPPPPPVKLVTVEDAVLPALAGSEQLLDEFYVGLLEFERDEAHRHPVYRGEKYRLHFELVEVPPLRQDMRLLGIEIASLPAMEGKLLVRQIEYERQRGMAGEERLVLRDPAGNFLALTQARRIL